MPCFCNCKNPGTTMPFVYPSRRRPAVLSEQFPGLGVCTRTDAQTHQHTHAHSIYICVYIYIYIEREREREREVTWGSPGDVVHLHTHQAVTSIGAHRIEGFNSRHHKELDAISSVHLSDCQPIPALPCRLTPLTATLEHSRECLFWRSWVSTNRRLKLCLLSTCRRRSRRKPQPRPQQRTCRSRCSKSRRWPSLLSEVHVVLELPSGKQRCKH